MNAHRWYTSGRYKWFTYCIKCGLMALKNAATRKRIQQGCKYNDEE